MPIEVIEISILLKASLHIDKRMPSTKLFKEGIHESQEMKKRLQMTLEISN